MQAAVFTQKVDQLYATCFVPLETPTSKWWISEQLKCQILSSGSGGDQIRAQMKVIAGLTFIRGALNKTQINVEVALKLPNM